MLSPQSRSRKNLARYWLHNSGWANTSTDPLLSSANGNVFSEAVWVQTGTPGRAEHTGDNPLFPSGSWAPPTLTSYLGCPSSSEAFGGREVLEGLDCGCWTLSYQKQTGVHSPCREESVRTAHVSRVGEWRKEQRQKDLRAGVKRPDFKYGQLLTTAFCKSLLSMR